MIMCNTGIYGVIERSNFPLNLKDSVRSVENRGQSLRFSMIPEGPCEC